MYILFIWIPEFLCLLDSVWSLWKGYFSRRQTVKSIISILSSDGRWKIAGKVDCSIAWDICCISLHLHDLHYLWSVNINHRSVEEYNVIFWEYVGISLFPISKHSRIWYVVTHKYNIFIHKPPNYSKKLFSLDTSYSYIFRQLQRWKIRLPKTRACRIERRNPSCQTRVYLPLFP